MWGIFFFSPFFYKTAAKKKRNNEMNKKLRSDECESNIPSPLGSVLIMHNVFQHTGGSSERFWLKNKV